MGSPTPVTRRRFLSAAVRAPRVAEVSCERLYVKYVDASATGRLAPFLASVQRDLASADEVRLVHAEWLTREDFRKHVGPLLRQPPT